MNEYENIMSKSTDDLRQIALAFGDFTPEEVGDKTREELIEKITGKTATEETPAEDKAASEAKEESPKKKGRTSKSKKEEAEETPAPKKRGRKSASAKKEEEVKEEPAPEVKEETPSESPSGHKRQGLQARPCKERTSQHG